MTQSIIPVSLPFISLPLIKENQVTAKIFDKPIIKVEESAEMRKYKAKLAATTLPPRNNEIDHCIERTIKDSL